ncbi:hypothetical protein BDU57DRAFT_508461 [Ampelomyces quisqualis]|uniref:Uncharacterized protein n=1 Tax=Ampelomyces quisqualis TaxID=50730 RepID=A0A6A5R2G2_AMPQU|nr:hypothetical protein BDU57DRAFT_508461 [Ampelomyces quisqualis]
MAGDKKKKRRPSPAPSRPSPAKRLRQASANLSIRSNSQVPTRERPGPYRPLWHSRGASPLPDSDDWEFRVKVISSPTNLDDQVFRKAVQGLVKICFPKGVLEELGVELLEKHMQAEKAPPANIARMIEVYRAEMIHRASQMLAEYLDTPAKVQLAVESVIGASSSLYMHLGGNIIQDIATGLEQTAHRQRADTVTADQLEHGLAASHGSANLSPQAQSHEDSDEVLVDVEDAVQGVDTNEPSSSNAASLNRRISGSWRWDVEPDSHAKEAMANVFKRMSDLFAYHALPIAKGLLAPGAPRKEIRAKMQNMMDSMPDDEMSKWVESFDKLKNGDQSMLVRTAPDVAHIGRTAATPAPIDRRRKPSNTSQALHQHEHHLTKIKNTMRKDRRVKREDHTEINAPKKGANTEQVLARPQPTKTMSATGNSGTDEATEAHTPILDLLWGRSPLSHSIWPQVVDTIMERLGHRIPAQSISLLSVGGNNRVITKTALQKQLRCTRGIKALEDKHLRIRVEDSLIPWAVAIPSAFPELMKEAYIFANMMPLSTPVLNTVCDSHTSMERSNAGEVKRKLHSALMKRGIDPSVERRLGHPALCAQISNMVGQTSLSDIMKRGHLERFLRYAAFERRNKFPELKSSQLVRAWEQTTGGKW